jgi:transcriptional regulator with XRE-family HTH domain
MDLRRVIGENVRRYRLAAGFSQEELAAKSGVAQAYVSSLESGTRNPTVLTLWHIAMALDVEPAQFLGRRRSRKAKRSAQAR